MELISSGESLELSELVVWIECEKFNLTKCVETRQTGDNLFDFHGFIEQ